MGLRPVICLKSGVKLQANASGGYDLIQPDVVVKENQATLEVTVGESNNTFDSLFTVTTKDGGTATKTYTLNGASTNIRNTSELAVGTHTITCIATYNWMRDSATVTVVIKEGIKPNITIKTNSNTTWAQTGSVTVALQDMESGLATGASIKYGWSETADTPPSNYIVATLPSYTDGTTSEVTFTAQASGLTGQYYLWVVPTTLKDTAGNTQTENTISTGQFYFDNQGPTAPTISGGNSSTSWATSRTIKVDTASTDTGIGTIANYEYCVLENSTAPTASTEGISLVSGVSSKIFNDKNYNGEYVYFRAVDGVGNKGSWSSAQRLYIDTVSPTITANNTSITINPGTSNTFESLFTITWGGITTGTASYTLNDESTNYENTSQLAVGTYTLTCTVNKNNGTSANATIEIKVEKPWEVGVTLSAANIAANPSMYSGMEVEGYTCTNSAAVNAWKVFYADSENIYLISDSCIDRNYVPKSRTGIAISGMGTKVSLSYISRAYDGSENILDTSITDSRIIKWIDYVVEYPTATNSNIMAVAYMLDCNIWSVYKDSTYAAYAIGGPTIELFAAGYNWAHPGINISYSIEELGYSVSRDGDLDTTDSTYMITDDNSYGELGFHLSAPGSTGKLYLGMVTTSGSVTSLDMTTGGWYYYGLRPLVCLNQGVKLTTIAGGKATINK